MAIAVRRRSKTLCNRRPSSATIDIAESAGVACSSCLIPAPHAGSGGPIPGP
jgi:hypothetical protein